MSTSFRQPSSMQPQEQLAIIVPVVVGYVAHFVSIGAADASAFAPAPRMIAVAILLGVIYLLFLLRQRAFFARFPSPGATALFFIAQLTLLLMIQLLMAIEHQGGIWLVSLPLAQPAVERLSPGWRWPVYVSIVAGVALPLGVRFGDWGGASARALLFSPALIFVVIFTRLRLSEQAARERAEQLAAQVEELATMRERNRLAREIHDTLGHYLTAVYVQLEAARAVMASQPENSAVAMKRAQDLTQKGLAALRQSVSALRASATEKWSLPEAIAALIEETDTEGAAIDLEVQGEPRAIESQAKLTLYRVAQEGLTNARKHAHASHVDLTLDYGDSDAVKLTVEDDGVGSSQTSVEGFGLVGIRERVQMLGGEVAVVTVPGQGFAISVAVPA